MQEYRVNWSIYFEKISKSRQGSQIWDQETFDILVNSDSEAQCLIELMDQGTESIGIDRLVDAENPENDFQWEEGPYHVEHVIVEDEDGDEVYRVEKDFFE